MFLSTRIEVTLTLSLLAAAGCAVGPTGPTQPNAGVVWPDPPNPPRIEFVGEYRRAADFGIRPGFWDRLTSLLAGSADDSMSRPMSVAVSNDDGVIFVADPDSGCIHRYDRRRDRYDCLVPEASEALMSPVSLAITGDEWLYVADSQLGRIFRVPPNGTRLEQFGSEDDVVQPTGVAWHNDTGRLYVTDTGTQSIKIFSKEGRMVREFGRRGSMPGELNFATYLWIDEPGHLLVTDSLNFRVQRFGLDGTFVHAFGEHGDLPGDLARPKGIATDLHGHVFVMDGLHHSMQIFNPAGDLLLAIGGRGRGAGEFWLPNGLFISPANVIYVADSYNKRIQVFRYIGADS